MSAINDVEADRDRWRSLCLRLVRHRLNPDKFEAQEWDNKGRELLEEVRSTDRLAYDAAVKPD